MIAWDQNDATGIPAIDAQHQGLFRSVQALHQAYRSGKAQEVLPGMLRELVGYCLTHFADEEAHMKRHGFPDLPFHRDEHQYLMARVHHLEDRLANGEPEVAMEVSILVSGWLKTHIKEHDQAFAAFLREQGQR